MTQNQSDGAANCPYIDRCPMFPLFRLDGVRQIYQKKYCRGQYSSCQRYQRASKGVMPDPRLLPDGRMLPPDEPTPKR